MASVVSVIFDSELGSLSTEYRRLVRMLLGHFIQLIGVN